MKTKLKQHLLRSPLPRLSFTPDISPPQAVQGEWWVMVRPQQLLFALPSSSHFPLCFSSVPSHGLQLFRTSLLLCGLSQRLQGNPCSGTPAVPPAFLLLSCWCLQSCFSYFPVLLLCLDGIFCHTGKHVSYRDSLIGQ